MAFQFLYRTNETIDEWNSIDDLLDMEEYISKKESIDEAIDDFEDNVWDIYEVADLSKNNKMINISNTKLSCHI